MKTKKIIVLVYMLAFYSCNSLFASDLDNVIRGMLDVVSEPEVYVFNPGEKIYSKMQENLYYSGFEYADGRKTLLLTLIENGNSIILKFPDPDIIQIKDLKIKIFSFDNETLKLQQYK